MRARTKTADFAGVDQLADLIDEFIRNTVAPLEISGVFRTHGRPADRTAGRSGTYRTGRRRRAQTASEWRGEQPAEEQGAGDQAQVRALTARRLHTLIDAQLAVISSIRRNPILQIDHPAVIELLRFGENFGSASSSLEPDDYEIVSQMSIPSTNGWWTSGQTESLGGG